MSQHGSVSNRESDAGMARGYNVQDTLRVCKGTSTSIWLRKNNPGGHVWGEVSREDKET